MSRSRSRYRSQFGVGVRMSVTVSNYRSESGSGSKFRSDPDTDSDLVSDQNPDLSKRSKAKPVSGMSYLSTTGTTRVKCHATLLAAVVSPSVHNTSCNGW